MDIARLAALDSRRIDAESEQVEAELYRFIIALPATHPLHSTEQPLLAEKFRTLLRDEAAPTIHPTVFDALVKRLPPYTSHQCVDIPRWLDDVRRRRSPAARFTHMAQWPHQNLV